MVARGSDIGKIRHSNLQPTPKNTVTVMVSNFGQSELLINFVCAAKSRNLDISSIIVFATDIETKELAEGLGLVAFYDKWVSIE